MPEDNEIDRDTRVARWPRCHPRWSVPAAAILLLGVTFWQLPGSSLLLGELQNFGHTLLFGVLALLVLCTYRAIAPANARHPLWAYLAAGTGCLLAGGAVEGIQALTGGDADARDVVRDLAGILIALCAGAAFDPRFVRPPRLSARIVLLGIALVLAVSSSWPLATLAWAHYQRARAFPVIIDPAAAWSAHYLRHIHARQEGPDDVTACAAPAGSAGLSRLRLAPVRYAGISVIEPYPDWLGHEMLVFELYSVESVPFDLALRIHDARHDQDFSDRFNRRLTLKPGPNRFRIPLVEVRDAPAGRRMDMSNIAGVMLFLPDATGPVSFCMGTLRLE